MISAQENEEKPEDRVSPITARKDYFIEDGIDKNSFRKLVLGTPEKVSAKELNESSSENDASLMKGLPASIKKLRQLSQERSRQSEGRNPIIRTDEAVMPDSDSSDVDFNLKFLNKKALMSGKSVPVIQNHYKSPSYQVENDRKSPYAKYHRNRNHKISHQTRKNRMTSFDRPSLLKPLNRPEEEKRIRNYDLSENPEEDKPLSLRESLGKSLPRMRSKPILKKKHTFGENKYASGSSIQNERDHLEKQRRMLKQQDGVNDSQYIGEDVSNYHPQENTKPDTYEMTRNIRAKKPSHFNYEPQRYHNQEKLPDINNTKNVEDFNDDIRNDINDLKEQLSALSK